MRLEKLKETIFLKTFFYLRNHRNSYLITLFYDLLFFIFLLVVGNLSVAFDPKVWLPKMQLFYMLLFLILYPLFLALVYAFFKHMTIKKIMSRKFQFKEFLRFYLFNLAFFMILTIIFFLIAVLLNLSLKEEIKSIAIFIYAVIFGFFSYPLVNFAQFSIASTGKYLKSIRSAFSEMNLKNFFILYLPFFIGLIAYLIFFLLIGFIVVIFKNDAINTIAQGALVVIGFILFYLANAFNRFYIFGRANLNTKEDHDRASHKPGII